MKMVQTRAEFEKKSHHGAVTPLQEPRRDKFFQPTEIEEEFFNKYATAFVTPRDDQHLLNCGVTSLIATGLVEWAFDPKGLKQFHGDETTYPMFGHESISLPISIPCQHTRFVV
jgi:hypothetical protein